MILGLCFHLNLIIYRCLRAKQMKARPVWCVFCVHRTVGCRHAGWKFVVSLWVLAYETETSLVQRK